MSAIFVFTSIAFHNSSLVFYIFNKFYQDLLNDCSVTTDTWIILFPFESMFVSHETSNRLFEDAVSWLLGLCSDVRHSDSSLLFTAAGRTRLQLHIIAG